MIWTFMKQHKEGEKILFQLEYTKQQVNNIKNNKSNKYKRRSIYTHRKFFIYKVAFQLDQWYINVGVDHFKNRWIFAL